MISIMFFLLLQSSVQHTDSERLQPRLPALLGSWTLSAARCRHGPPPAGTAAGSLQERRSRHEKRAGWRLKMFLHIGLFKVPIIYLWQVRSTLECLLCQQLHHHLSCLELQSVIRTLSSCEKTTGVSRCCSSLVRRAEN